MSGADLKPPEVITAVGGGGTESVSIILRAIPEYAKEVIRVVIIPDGASDRSVAAYLPPPDQLYKERATCSGKGA